MSFAFHNPKPSPANNFVTQQYDVSPFRELPAPTGPAPYRLDVTQVLGLLPSTTKMVFHTLGDTGGVKTPQDQQIVANKTG